jgi:hypothetical protein
MIKAKVMMACLFLLALTATARQGIGASGEVNFFENYIEVKGIGIPAASVPAGSPQAYATARRAAVVDANRNIAEIVSTIQIDSQSVNELSQAVQDTVRQSVSTKIRGGQVLKETSMGEFTGNDIEKAGKVEVIMRIPLSGTGGVINAIMPTLRPEIIKRTDEAKLPTYNPSPAPAAMDYDALIVRVPATFKPAIAPKIMTDKGEVLYSAKDVAVDILVSRGAAQYTNNDGKAKTILEGMGAKIILDVQGAPRTDTDAEIKADDAAKVFNANKKTAFLSKGRIVFLVAKAS